MKSPICSVHRHLGQFWQIPLTVVWSWTYFYSSQWRLATFDIQPLEDSKGTAFQHWIKHLEHRPWTLPLAQQYIVDEGCFKFLCKWDFNTEVYGNSLGTWKVSKCQTCRNSGTIICCTQILYKWLYMDLHWVQFEALVTKSQTAWLVKLWYCIWSWTPQVWQVIWGMSEHFLR